MGYKVRVELLNELEMTALDFESNSSTHITNSFDQINWAQQSVWGFLEEHQGDFPFFQVEHIQTGRKFGGLFVVYSRNEYNFHAHTELYQKQQKSHLFGLFKSESLPSFDNENLPFDVFRNCLEKFLQGNDAEIERLFQIAYPSYVNTGVWDR